jgi:hypothetical protein
VLTLGRLAMSVRQFEEPKNGLRLVVAGTGRPYLNRAARAGQSIAEDHDGTGHTEQQDDSRMDERFGDRTLGKRRPSTFEEDVPEFERAELWPGASCAAAGLGCANMTD